MFLDKALRMHFWRDDGTNIKATDNVHVLFKTDGGSMKTQEKDVHSNE